MIIDLKNCTIKIKDGTTPTPLEVTVRVGEGTLSYTEKFNREYKKDRGKLYQVRNGDEEPVDVKMDFLWEFLKASSGGTATIEDALKQRGGASAWVSTDSDTCAPYSVDLEITHTPVCESEDVETILLSDFRVEQLDHDPKAGTVSCTGKCNVKEATVTRS